MASAAEDLRKRVKKDDRIAFRRQKTENIQTVGQEEADTTPAGLWYGCGTGWLEFASSEFESGLGKYVYKLDIDYSKVLRISEDGQLLKFTSEFKAPLRDYEKIFKGGRETRIQYRLGESGLQIRRNRNKPVYPRAAP